MRLNKSTSHAIRILIECAREPGSLTKAGQLSITLDLTIQNTLKVMHILSRAGLVTPVRGRNGGIRLARPAADVRIGDVVRAMQCNDFEIDVGARKRAVSGVSQVLEGASEAFFAVLDRHTLADFAIRSSNGGRGITAPPEASTSPRGDLEPTVLRQRV
jgi:Rrf2 family nitric oxide-sensitive transcriptional repressor